MTEMVELTHEDKVFQYQACVAAGVNTDNLDPNKNCFSLKGDMAMIVQAACERLDPAKAARLRLKANPDGISMSTWAAENGLREHDQNTRKNLLQYDETAVIQHQANQKAEDERLTRWMESETRKSQEKRGVMIDPDDVQIMNPALAGPFAKYAEQVNLDARMERRLANENK